MRERHNWATGKHPKTCTCAACERKRAEALTPRPKKKRKPKSQRGKGKTGGKQTDSTSALDEAMDIFGFPVASDESPDEASDDKGEAR